MSKKEILFHGVFGLGFYLIALWAMAQNMEHQTFLYMPIVLLGLVLGLPHHIALRGDPNE